MKLRYWAKAWYRILSLKKLGKKHIIELEIVKQFVVLILFFINQYRKEIKKA